jgi:hypothetical protein
LQIWNHPDLLHKAWERQLEIMDYTFLGDALVDNEPQQQLEFNGQLQSNSNGVYNQPNNYFQAPRLDFINNSYGNDNLNGGAVNGYPASNSNASSGGLLNQLQKHFQSNAPFQDRFSELFGQELRNSNAPVQNVPMQSNTNG